MNFWNTLAGEVTVTLTSADPAGALKALTDRRITLTRVEWVEELTVRFRCRRREVKPLKELCRKRGDQLQISRETGVAAWGSRVLDRPVLASGMALFFALTLYLPTRVLFFQVEGNETIPARQILEAATDCGIRFGASRRQVRSEKMKNALLGAMPELKWAGINTSGCRAVISVRERVMPEEAPVSSLPGNIVSVRDAYVTELTVTRGSALCAPGQVVKEGQVLISGVTDLGRTIQVTRAEGEIFGETSRNLRVVTPAVRTLRQQEGGIQWRLSLILGKKRINFGKGSGISPQTCGRIYQEYGLVLPGGFTLPFRLALEVVTPWETGPESVALEELEAGMAACARSQILSRTLAGNILNETLNTASSGECLWLEGRFLCREMIGRINTNAIGEVNGKTD